jgi:phospholipid/cholesterol/gamma-HCH transport system substrate-binding protein
MSPGKNLVLGGFVLIVLIGLTYSTFQLAGVDLGPRADWTVYFGSESWIREGFDVYTAGTKVGRVGRVELVPDAELAEGRHVRAVLHLDAGITLFQGAKVRLESTGFLGSRAVIVDRGDPRAPRLAPGTELHGQVGSDVVDELQRILRSTSERLDRALDNVAEVAERVNRGEGSLGMLLTRAELYDDVKAATAELRVASAKLNDPETPFGMLLADRGLAADLRDGVARLRAVTEEAERVFVTEKAGENLAVAAREVADALRRFQRGGGAAYRLLYDEELGRDVRNGLADLAAIVREARDGKGTIGRLLKDPRAYDELAGASEELRAILAHVRAGKGTLGRLLMDDRVARDLEAMLQSFRETSDVARENAPLSTLTSFTSLFFNVLN